MLIKDIKRREADDFEDSMRNLKSLDAAEALVHQIAKDLPIELNPGSLFRLTKMAQDRNGHASNIIGTTNYLFYLLSCYNYSNKEIEKFINDNCRILTISNEYVNKLLAILHQFNLDEEILFGNLYNFVTNAISSDELYAYLCLMSEKDEKVKIIDILNLNRNIDKGYKEKLLQIYPLTPRVMGPMYYMYNQYLKNLEKEKTL